MIQLKQFQTIPALLAHRVKATPSETAFIEKEASGLWQTTSWQQFDEAVADMANKLQRAGLQPGEQVGVLMPNGIQWEILQHAVYRIGGVVIGLDLNDAFERMRDIFSLCAPKLLFVDRTTRLKHIPQRNLEALRLIVADTLDSGAHHGINLCALAALPRGTEKGSYPLATEDMTATILFTSGTTGRPKALAYQHDQLVVAIRAIVRNFADLPGQAHTACWLPLANPFQRIINFCALAMNWKVFMVPTPATIMAQVKEIEPDLFAAVPRFYEKLFDGIHQNIRKRPKGMRAAADWALRTERLYRQTTAAGKRPVWRMQLKHRIADRLVLQKIRKIMGARLRYFISGSAAMPKRLIEAFETLGWPVLEAYGISENIVPMAMNVPGAVRPGSVGRPLAENTIRIDVDGQILVKGAGVVREMAAFTEDGFLITGDIGTLDEDGYLWLTGRKSDMFKLSTGRKVVPRAIEEAIENIEGVEHAIAAGANRKYVVALLNVPFAQWHHLSEKYTGSDGALNYLREQMRSACAYLPHYCRPVDIAVITDDFMPQTGELTANLKLRRGFVLEKYAQTIEALYQRIDGRHS